VACGSTAVGSLNWQCEGSASHSKVYEANEIEGKHRTKKVVSVYTNQAAKRLIG